MKARPEEQLCPIHGIPMYYWRRGDQYACQNSDCLTAHGVSTQELHELERRSRTVKTEEEIKAKLRELQGRLDKPRLPNYARDYILASMRTLAWVLGSEDEL